MRLLFVTPKARSDVDLTTCALTDQLGCIQAKATVVVFTVAQQFVSADKVDHLAVLTHDTDDVANPGGPVRYERQ